jgi:hypothetical protein
MSHVRKQIRDRVATVCTGLSTTGTKVFKGRGQPINAERLPALGIYTRSETAAAGTIGATKISDRRLTVVVEVYARDASVVDDVIDASAVEVEEAISVDTTLNDLALRTIYTGFELETDGDGEQTIGIGRLTFDVLYRVDETDVETAL